MHSIAVALLTETETQLTSMVAALAHRPAQLTAPGVRQVLAAERVLPAEQVTDPAAELEISEPAIVPAANLELEAVWAI
jgi:hypothetical protein